MLLQLSPSRYCVWCEVFWTVNKKYWKKSEMLRYYIIQKYCLSHIALQWNSFLDLNHNKLNSLKSYGKKEYNREINLSDLWRKMCLHHTVHRKKLTPEWFYMQTILAIATGILYRYSHTSDTDVVVLAIVFSKRYWFQDISKEWSYK